jgi:small neutral amino acid transporter SnatA (MarC family)
VVISSFQGEGGSLLFLEALGYLKEKSKKKRKKTITAIPTRLLFPIAVIGNPVSVSLRALAKQSHFSFLKNQEI